MIETNTVYFVGSGPGDPELITLKAKRIFREYLNVNRNFTGRHFWARGYCVSTVGLDEKIIREYIKNQEREEKRQEQLRLHGV